MVNDKRDEIIINNIKKSLDLIDSMEVNTPDMGFFRNMVAQAEEKKKAKSKRETIIFIISAIIILSLETYAFNQSQMIFLLVQVGAFLSIPFAFLIAHKMRKRQHGVS
jgi:hypothetical protein